MITGTMVSVTFGVRAMRTSSQSENNDNIIIIIQKPKFGLL